MAVADGEVTPDGRLVAAPALEARLAGSVESLRQLQERLPNVRVIPETYAAAFVRTLPGELPLTGHPDYAVAAGVGYLSRLDQPPPEVETEQAAGELGAETGRVGEGPPAEAGDVGEQGTVSRLAGVQLEWFTGVRNHGEETIPLIAGLWQHPPEHRSFIRQTLVEMAREHIPAAAAALHTIAPASPIDYSQGEAVGVAISHAGQLSVTYLKDGAFVETRLVSFDASGDVGEIILDLIEGLEETHRFSMLATPWKGPSYVVIDNHVRPDGRVVPPDDIGHGGYLTARQVKSLEALHASWARRIRFLSPAVTAEFLRVGRAQAAALAAQASQQQDEAASQAASRMAELFASATTAKSQASAAALLSIRQQQVLAEWGMAQKGQGYPSELGAVNSVPIHHRGASTAEEIGDETNQHAVTIQRYAQELEALQQRVNELLRLPPSAHPLLILDRKPSRAGTRLVRKKAYAFNPELLPFGKIVEAILMIVGQHYPRRGVNGNREQAAQEIATLLRQHNASLRWPIVETDPRSTPPAGFGEAEQATSELGSTTVRVREKLPAKAGEAHQRQAEEGSLTVEQGRMDQGIEAFPDEESGMTHQRQPAELQKPEEGFAKRWEELTLEERLKRLDAMGVTDTLTRLGALFGEEFRTAFLQLTRELAEELSNWRRPVELVFHSSALQQTPEAGIALSQLRDQLTRFAGLLLEELEPETRAQMLKPIEEASTPQEAARRKARLLRELLAVESVLAVDGAESDEEAERQAPELLAAYARAYAEASGLSLETFDRFVSAENSQMVVGPQTWVVIGPEGWVNRLKEGSRSRVIGLAYPDSAADGASQPVLLGPLFHAGLALVAEPEAPMEEIAERYQVRSLGGWWLCAPRVPRELEALVREHRELVERQEVLNRQA